MNDAQWFLCVLLFTCEVDEIRDLFSRMVNRMHAGVITAQDLNTVLRKMPYQFGHIDAHISKRYT